MWMTNLTCSLRVACKPRAPSRQGTCGRLAWVAGDMDSVPRPDKHAHNTLRVAKTGFKQLGVLKMGQGVSLQRRKRQGPALLSACRSGSSQLAAEVR